MAQAAQPVMSRPPALSTREPRFGGGYSDTGKANGYSYDEFQIYIQFRGHQALFNISEALLEDPALFAHRSSTHLPPAIQDRMRLYLIDAVAEYQSHKREVLGLAPPPVKPASITLRLTPQPKDKSVPSRCTAYLDTIENNITQIATLVSKLTGGGKLERLIKKHAKKLTTTVEPSDDTLEILTQIHDEICRLSSFIDRVNEIYHTLKDIYTQAAKTLDQTANIANFNKPFDLILRSINKILANHKNEDHRLILSRDVIPFFLAIVALYDEIQIMQSYDQTFSTEEMPQVLLTLGQETPDIDAILQLSKLVSGKRG